MTVTVVREAPSNADRLALTVRLPDGSGVRWADDEPDIERIPQDFTFSRSLPGGDADLGCQLLRDMRRRAGDLANYNETKLYGPGGESVWRGYLTKTPDTATSVSPAATGDVGRLKDDTSFRMIPVDRDLGHWQEPPLARRAQMLTSSFTCNGYRVEADPDTGKQAINTALIESWGRLNSAEAYYDAGTLGFAELYYDLSRQGPNGGDANWNLLAGGTDIDTATGVVSSNLSGASGPAYFAPGGKKRWARLQTYYAVAVAGTAGKEHATRWQNPTVYGGEVARTPNPAGGPDGVLFPNVLRAILGKVNCGIGYDSDSIAADPFVIPHLVWLEPTTPDQAILEGNRFYRNPWAVYDRKLRWQPPESFGRLWYVRRDEGAQITSNGPDSEQEFTGVIVKYNDALTGTPGIVGPPATGLVGSLGLSTTTLVDADPDLALNKWGRRRYAVLQAGLTSEPGAIRQGELFMAGLKKIAVSGQITIDNRQVFDSTGARYPAWAPKAGDRLLTVDEANAAERLIISDSGGRAPRTLTLDSPDDGLKALIERLGVVLVGVV